MTTQESGDSGGNPKDVGFGKPPADLVEAELIRAVRLADFSDKAGLGTTALTGTEYVERISERLRELFEQRARAQRGLHDAHEAVVGFEDYLARLKESIGILQARLNEATAGTEHARRIAERLAELFEQRKGAKHDLRDAQKAVANFEDYLARLKESIGILQARQDEATLGLKANNEI